MGGRWEAEVLCGFGAAWGGKARRGRGLALRRKGGKDSLLTRRLGGGLGGEGGHSCCKKADIKNSIHEFGQWVYFTFVTFGSQQKKSRSHCQRG